MRIESTLPSCTVFERFYGPDNSVIVTKKIRYCDSQLSKEFWDSVMN